MGPDLGSGIKAYKTRRFPNQIDIPESKLKLWEEPGHLRVIWRPAVRASRNYSARETWTLGPKTTAGLYRYYDQGITSVYNLQCIIFWLENNKFASNRFEGWRKGTVCVGRPSQIANPPKLTEILYELDSGFRVGLLIFAPFLDREVENGPDASSCYFCLSPNFYR